MSPRTISPELVASLKRLRLGGLLPTLAERFILAEKDDTPYEDLLLLLLTDEISRRDSNAAIRRADLAGLDPDMVLERWDKTVTARTGAPGKGGAPRKARHAERWAPATYLSAVISSWIQR